jgi:hypothetical protein
MQCSGVKLAVMSKARIVRLNDTYHEVHSTENIAQCMHLQRVDQNMYLRTFTYFCCCCCGLQLETTLDGTVNVTCTCVGGHCEPVQGLNIDCSHSAVKHPHRV